MVLLLSLTLAGVWADDTGRKPADKQELRGWLENMVWYHQMEPGEIQSATGLSNQEIQSALREFKIDPSGRPARAEGDVLLVLPYPGGRHPRLGFQDGAMEPQRETKISIFTPWDPQSYVVADIPEAIWWRRKAPETEDKNGRELIFLAHRHIDTYWTRQGRDLQELEWKETGDGGYEMSRRLPNGISFGTRVIPHADHVEMEQWLTNGLDREIRGLRVQNCVMLGHAEGFEQFTRNNKRFTNPYAVCRNSKGDRWIIHAWAPGFRCWGNAKVPCLHSDPQFPDCKPGETVHLKGWLSFYEGRNIEMELSRIEATNWHEGVPAVYERPEAGINGGPGRVIRPFGPGRGFGPNSTDTGRKPLKEIQPFNFQR